MKIMKKEYIKPQVEVVKLEIHHMLAASPPNWDKEIQAPEFEDWSWDLEAE